jgi:hypothetical protein
MSMVLLATGYEEVRAFPARRTTAETFRLAECWQWTMTSRLPHLLAVRPSRFATMLFRFTQAGQLVINQNGQRRTLFAFRGDPATPDVGQIDRVVLSTSISAKKYGIETAACCDC